MRNFALILSLAFILAMPATAGELSDHGPDGIMFQDDETGFTWFDPTVFLDISRAHAELFITASPVWRWATEPEIISLIGSTGIEGAALETIMGPRTSTIGGGGPRWTAFFAGTTPADGALAQSSDDPDFNLISSTGTQSATYSMDHGAWMVATVDPVVQPRLDHLGSADVPYFFDEESSLYWQDPVTFEDMDRADIQSWIDANSDWRWATVDEVKGLLGKLTVGNVAPVDVLGAGQFNSGPGIVRWIGYCDGIAVTSAATLQMSNGAVLPLITIYSEQANAASWHPGAWIVSEVNPTPVTPNSLSKVKSMFRD